MLLLLRSRLSILDASMPKYVFENSRDSKEKAGVLAVTAIVVIVVVVVEVVVVAQWPLGSWSTGHEFLSLVTPLRHRPPPLVRRKVPWYTALVEGLGATPEATRA